MPFAPWHRGRSLEEQGAWHSQHISSMLTTFYPVAGMNRLLRSNAAHWSTNAAAAMPKL
jgi:hypothetical protein